MSEPTNVASLEEIQAEIAGDIVWLGEVISKHPRWTWPAPMLNFVKELQMLSLEKPLNATAIKDYQDRLKQHVVENRLKGMEPKIWNAESLYFLATKNAA